MKIATILGARPQFIKAAPVSRALRVENLQELLIHTGQHYDHKMSDVFFQELGLADPDFNLGVGSGLHGEQTGAMLAGIEKILIEQQPDAVLVYGDTNSTLAGALAASKLHIPVAHVEAGLRSFNRRMPEEINRVVTDHISELLFIPTEAALTQLGREGITRGCHRVGDVMYDIHLEARPKMPSLRQAVGVVELSPKGYALATVHRAENTDDPERMRAIIGGLNKLSETIRVILPLHPRARKMLASAGLALSPKLHIIEPVGYLAMLSLEVNASLIVTDSGGVQKEAYFARVPCVTLRDETEWVELADAGWNRVVPPTSAEEIAEAARSALGTTGQSIELYGDGHAATQIARILAGWLAKRSAHD